MSSPTDDNSRYEAAYVGHGRGVVITNNGDGTFAERSMTAAERTARAWAMSISRGIDELYLRGSAAFSYHRAWEFVALAIAQARDQGYRAGWDACRADLTDGASLTSLTRGETRNGRMKAAPHTIEAQLACVQREIKMRENVYGRRVSEGKMNAHHAEHELATMKAVLTTLIQVAQN